MAELTEGSKSLEDCLEMLDNEYRKKLEKNKEAAEVCLFKLFGICFSSTTNQDMLKDLNKQTEKWREAAEAANKKKHGTTVVSAGGNG